MTAMMQLEFDLDALMPPPPIPEYMGRAPMHYTGHFFTVDELADAFRAWVTRNGSFGSHPRSHMWVSATEHPAPAGHTFTTMTADLRCSVAYDHPRGCSCVGALLHRAQCDVCEWVAVGNENHVIEAWHDHAWPGWRDLPVMPLKDRESPAARSKRTTRWAQEHQPLGWQVEGAPIRTARDGLGTRHVESRSPWKGYDLAETESAR